MSPRLRIREQRQLARTYARPDALTHMAHPCTLLQDFLGYSNGNNTTISCPHSELHTEFDFEAAQAPEGIDAHGGPQLWYPTEDRHFQLLDSPGSIAGGSEKWIIDLLWETRAGAVANFSWEKVRSPHFSRIFSRRGLSFLVFFVVITLTSPYFN